jgi:DNA-binding YbaB/EbfC family protein
MKGLPGGMQGLMKQANQMQLKMKKVQEELATREFEGTSGGGAVQVKVTGDTKVSKVIIGADVMKSGDVEMLQDLILTATNDAIRLAKETSQKEMDKVTGGLNIPGMF